MTPEQRATIDEVLEAWSGHISTHYEGCWTRHVACLAQLLKDMDSDH